MTGPVIASLAISGAALIAAIFGNFVIAKQAREMKAQSNKLARDLALSAGASVNGWFVEIGRTFMDHPRLRLLFYPWEAGGAFLPLELDDELRAKTLCENFLDAFQDAADFAQDELVPWSNDYHAYFTDLMCASDYLYEFLLSHAAWYKPELLAAASRARRLRHSTPAQPPSTEIAP